MGVTQSLYGIALSCAVASAGLIIASSTHADSARPPSRGCVSHTEFEKAKTGMTVKQVARLFGTKGKQYAKSSSYGVTIEMRSYHWCTEFGVRVLVHFTNGRLDTKGLTSTLIM
jgi:hypothetical protein